MMQIPQWQTIPLFFCYSRKTKEFAWVLLKYVIPELRQWCQQWRLHLKDFFYFQEQTKSKTIYESVVDRKKSIFVFFDIDSWVDFPDDLVNLHKPSVESFLQVLDENTYPFFYFGKEKSKLKKEISKHYGQHIRIGLGDSKEFRIKVQEDLKKAISHLLQKHMEVVWQQREQGNWSEENHLQDVFAENYCPFFAGRNACLDRLYDYTTGNSSEVFVVAGEKGLGKTALLAQLYKNHKHLMLYGKTQKTLFLPYFLTAKRDIVALLQNICLELQKHHLTAKTTTLAPFPAFAMPNNIPDLLLLLQEQSPAFDRLVIVIDGFELIDSSFFCNTEDKFMWLPDKLPPHIKWIVSISDYFAIEGKTNNILSLEPLSKNELQYSIEEKWCLDINFSKRKNLLLAKASQNPLYLELLGKFLPKKFPQSCLNFFGNWLKQIEQKFQKKGEDWVEIFFTLIWCSHEGLTQEELQDIFYQQEESYQDFFLCAKIYLINNEIVTFKHLQLSDAVALRYAKKKQDSHDFLAEYFSQQPLHLDKKLNRRKLIELPWQLLNAHRESMLLETLCNLELIEAYLEIDLIFHWNRIVLEAQKQWPNKVLHTIKEIIDSQLLFLQKHPKSLAQILLSFIKNASEKTRNAIKTLVKKRLLQAQFASLEQIIPQSSDLLPTILRYKGKETYFARFSSNKIFTVSEDKGLQIWNSYGKLMYSWKRGDFKILWVGANGYKIIVQSFHSLLMINPYNENILQKTPLKLKEHSSRVCVSLDGSKIAVAQVDRIWIYKLPEWELCFKENKIRHVTCMTFSSDGNFFLRGDFEGVIHIWDGQRKLSFRKHISAPIIAIQAHNDKVASIVHGQLLIWNLHTHKILFKQPNKTDFDQSATANFCFSPDGGKLAFACFNSTNMDKITEIIDVNTQKPIRAIKSSKTPSCLTFSPDASKLLCGFKDGSVKVWATYLNRKNLENKHKIIYNLVFDHKSSIFICQTHHHLQIWNIASKKFLQELSFSQYQHYAGGIDLFVANNKIFAASENFFFWWDSYSADPYVIEHGRRKSTSKPVFSSDNCTIAFSRANRVYLWDCNTKTNIKMLKAYNVVRHLAFSPDASKLLSISGKEVLVWDVETGKLQQSFKESHKIQAVNFHSDNKRIALAAETYVKVWDIKTAQKIHSFRATATVQDACFSGEKIFAKTKKGVQVFSCHNKEYLQTLSSDIDIYSWANKLIPYGALAEEGETVIVEKGSGQKIAFFPIALNLATINPQNNVVGFLDDQLYILQII